MQPSRIRQNSSSKVTSIQNKISSDESIEQCLNAQQSIEKMLDSVLPQQIQKNKITRTRKHLGEIGERLNDEQLDCINTEFQFLIDTWLDEYEKEVFEGKTIKEAINEK